MLRGSGVQAGTQTVAGAGSSRFDFEPGGFDSHRWFDLTALPPEWFVEKKPNRFASTAIVADYHMKEGSGGLPGIRGPANGAEVKIHPGSALALLLALLFRAMDNKEAGGRVSR